MSANKQKRAGARKKSGKGKVYFVGFFKEKESKAEYKGANNNGESGNKVGNSIDG